MEIVLNDMRGGYLTMINRVLTQGRRVRVRGLSTYELTGTTLVFPAPTAYEPMLPIGIGRGVNVALAHVEALAAVGGIWPGDRIAALAPHYADVLIAPDEQVEVAYGPRLADQLADVVNVLDADPTSRGALATIWRPDDLTRSGDKPCTVALQFMIRDRALELHVTMRSQDVWLGAAMDMFVFTQVRNTLARVLDVAPGAYYHHVGSLHVYAHDVNRTVRLHSPTPLTRRLPYGIAADGPNAACNRWDDVVSSARILLDVPCGSDPAWRDAVIARNRVWYDNVNRVHKTQEAGT